ncbi:MAG: hypothetical protein HY291_03130 [Planctomycetes bacterium]|nr:hypothetical protein [Planctomycetota bacterium]
MKITHGVSCLTVLGLALAAGAARGEDAPKNVVRGESSVKVEKGKEPKAPPIQAPASSDDALTTALGKALNPKDPWNSDGHQGTSYKYKGAAFRTYKPTVAKSDGGTKVVVKIQLLQALARDDKAELELNFGKANELLSARAVANFVGAKTADTGLITSPVTVSADEADPALASRNIISHQVLAKLLDGVYEIKEEGSREWYAENIQRHIHLISDILAGFAKPAAAPVKAEAPKAAPQAAPAKPEAAK